MQNEIYDIHRIGDIEVIGMGDVMLLQIKQQQNVVE
jgi:hypothetical protein